MAALWRDKVIFAVGVFIHLNLRLIVFFFFFSQVLMVRFASLFNVKEQTVTFISGATYSLEELRAMGMSELLGAMFDFSHKLAALELSTQELGLFTAVVLVSAGEEGR